VRAAVVRKEAGGKVLRTEQVDDPPLARDDDVLVRVRRAGICGSDVHGFLDKDGPSRRDGLIMGHEAAGEVVRVGAAVTRVTAGDRVTIDPQITCGVCEPCRHGWISICDHKQVTGSSLRGFAQGSMAELIVVDQKQLFSVPDSVSFAQAAMVEPLANALHVVRRAEIAGGELAVVLGAGPLGLCIVGCLRAAGVGTIVVTDVSERQLRLANDLGADICVNVATQDLRRSVGDLSHGNGADVVIESVGIDVTYTQAIEVVRKRGKVMFFGAIQPTISLPLLPILHKELQLVGCTGANDETPDAITMLADRAIDLDPLMTHEFALEDADQAMRTLSDAGTHSVKVQVAP
jgi:2-desacetyl-2-hydroxyethyl bacteriochlorophyllide A dehydrogenase